MSLNVSCIICREELNEPGALLISSPIEHEKTRGEINKEYFYNKLHFCVNCERWLDEIIMDKSLGNMGFKKES